MDKTDLYWQSRLGSLERRMEKIEAQMNAYSKNPLNIGDYYTVPQMAVAIHVSELTVRRKIQNGTLKAVKVGKAWRIPKTELEEVLE